MKNGPDLMIAVGDQDPDKANEAAEAPEAPATSNTEQCVPLESLAMPDDSEQMANPEVGDPVTYTVEGKVTKVEGGMAYVEPTSINGKPVDKKAETPTPDEQDANDYADLESQAKQQGAM